MQQTFPLLAILTLCAACAPDVPSGSLATGAATHRPPAVTETPAAGYHIVTLDTARWYVNTFRAATADTGAGSLGATFGAADVRALLTQTGVTRLRIYNGMHDDGSPALVLVGADDQDHDVLTMVLQQGQPCPPFCPAQALGQE